MIALDNWRAGSIRWLGRPLFEIEALLLGQPPSLFGLLEREFANDFLALSFAYLLHLQVFGIKSLNPAWALSPQVPRSTRFTGHDLPRVAGYPNVYE